MNGTKHKGRGGELFQCFYIYIIWILSSWMIIFLWISQMGTGLCLVRKEWWEICVLIELGALITTLYTDLYIAVGCNVESEPNLISSMFFTHCFCIWSESDLMCWLISQEDNEAYFLFMFTWMRAKLLKYGEFRIFSQLNVVDLRSGLYVNYGESIVFCTSYQILVCTFCTLNLSKVSYSQSNIVEFLRICTASHFLFRVCFSTAGWYMLPTCTYRIVLIIEACLAIFVSNEIQLKCYFFLLFLFVHSTETFF